MSEANMNKDGWEVLEEKLKQKRAEWSLYPERRARLEAEAKVLRAGISFMKNKASKVFPEDKLMKDAQEALL